MKFYDIDNKSIIDICLKSSYISRICLKFTCKRLNDIIIGEALDILPIVKSRLNRHFEGDEETKQFIKLISKFGIISGSFVLSCIFDDDNIDYNDIDIYENVSIVKKEWKEKYKKYDLILNGNERRGKRRNYHKKFFVDEIVETVDNNDIPWYPGHKIYNPGQYTRLSKFLLRPNLDQNIDRNYDIPPYYEESHYARDFIINNMSFQHIIVDSDPTKYIKNTFDMDICKNYFDGKKVYV